MVPNLSYTVAHLNGMRTIADELNARIRLPATVEWEAVRRDRKKSVVHIRVRHTFQWGTLRRRGGDLLCGDNHIGLVLAQAVDGAGNTYFQAVTCKTCLHRAGVFSPNE